LLSEPVETNEPSEKLKVAFVMKSLRLTRSKRATWLSVTGDDQVS